MTTRMVTGPLDGPGLSALLNILTEPTPATFMREVLIVYLDKGYTDFEQAWAQGMRMIPKSLPERAAWKAVLRQVKPRFAEGWARRLAELCEAA